MKNLLKFAAGTTLAIAASQVMAAPAFLTTHNKTDVQSNAWVGGHPSPYPTNPNSTNKVMWGMVQLACAPVMVNGLCSADIKMETESNNPVMLGRLTMNAKTGEITPKSISANGYHLTVDGIGEVTLSKD